MSAAATAIAPRLGLVLTRQTFESIVVVTPAGERIVVTLVDVRETKARIGVLAPPSCAIHRGEALTPQDAARGTRHDPAVPHLALGPDSTDLLRQHRPTGS